MKLDQNTLAKNRFWVVLGVFLPVWLLVVFFLSFVDDEISKKRGEYETALKSVQSTAGFKSQRFIDPLDEKKKLLEKQKQKVWEKAWKGQDGLMTWPGNTVGPLDRGLRYAYFGDPINPIWCKEYGENLYHPQFDELPVLVKPAYFRDGFTQCIRPVAQWTNPTPEELWLAQEDLWVKREVLYVIRDAISSVARFKPVGRFNTVSPLPHEIEAAKQLPPTATVQWLQNPNWRLQLVLERNDKQQVFLSGRSVLTNINPTRQPMPLQGLRFTVEQRNRNGAIKTHIDWAPEGSPVDFGKAAYVTKHALLTPYDAELSLEIDEATFRPTVMTALETEAVSKLPAGTRVLWLQNPNWRLLLLLESNAMRQLQVSGKSVLTNIHSLRRVLPLNGIRFWVRQRDREGGDEQDRGVRWVIEGDPVKFGDSALAKQSVVVGNPDPNLIIEVEQGLNWQQSPIKRVDRIEVGNPMAQSNRTFKSRPLQAKVFEKKDPNAVDPNAVDPNAPPVPGGEGVPPAGPGPMGLRGFPGGEGGMAGGATGLVNGTPNGLERNRYIDISDQCRRIPIGVALVVDQAFLPDVLTAFANSRLRMWTTQSQWQRALGVQPPLNASLETAPGVPGGEGGVVGRAVPGGEGFTGRPGFPAAGSFQRGASFPGGMRPGFPMGPVPAMGGEGGATGQGPEEDDPNLIEVAIYNVASLYERYPPRAPAPTEGASPMGTPAGAAPAAPMGSPPAAPGATPTGPAPAPAGTAPAPAVPAGTPPAPAGAVPPPAGAATPAAAPAGTPPGNP